MIKVKVPDWDYGEGLWLVGAITYLEDKFPIPFPAMVDYPRMMEAAKTDPNLQKLIDRVETITREHRRTAPRSKPLF